MPPHDERAPSRPVTLVCWFLAGAAGDGRLAGRVEVVDTGEVVAVADAGDLVDLVARVGRSSDGAG